MSAVPGSMTGTGSAPADTSARITAAGRCPRCERWPWESRCPGVTGEPGAPVVAFPLADEGGRAVLGQDGTVILAA